MLKAQQEAFKDSNINWVDGLGPSGPTNPKVKGFVLGRYSKKRINPKELQRPKGMQRATLSSSVASIRRRVKCCNENVEVDTAVVQCHGCKTFWHPQCLLDTPEGGVCCEGKAVLLMPKPRPRSEKEIAEERAREGISRPKGIQRY